MVQPFSNKRPPIVQPFSSKSPPIVQPVAAQNPPKKRYKLEVFLNHHFPALPFSTLKFSNGFQKLATIGQQSVLFGQRSVNQVPDVQRLRFLTLKKKAEILIRNSHRTLINKVRLFSALRHHYRFHACPGKTCTSS